MSCAVYSCKSNRGRGSISMYSFPRNAKLCKIWKTFCGEGSRVNSTFQPLKDARICVKHFATSCFNEPQNPALGCPGTGSRKGICRICTQPIRRAAVDLFEDITWEGYTNLAEFVGTICGVVISREESSLPRFCCKQCRSYLHAAHRLRKLCQESDRQLRDPSRGTTENEICLEVEMISQIEEEVVEIVSSNVEPQCDSKEQREEQIEEERNPGCQHMSSFQNSTFSSNDEAVIVSWLEGMHQKGFPITLENIQYKVCKLVEANPKKVALHGKLPERSWLEAFCERHPELTRLVQVSTPTSSVSQRAIKSWFNSLHSFLEEHTLQDVLKSPARIMIAFGTEFYLDEHPTGATGAPVVRLASTEKNITVLHCVSAATYIYDPEIVIHSQRLSDAMRQTVPRWWGVDASEQGSLTTAILVRWITEQIHPALVRRRVKFPVFLFLDDQTSSVAFEAADACLKLGIIVIALYPGVKQLFQPPEVGLFELIKQGWTEYAGEVLQANGTCTLVTLATFLKSAFLDTTTHSVVKDTFQQCGLFP